MNWYDYVKQEPCMDYTICIINEAQTSEMWSYCKNLTINSWTWRYTEFIEDKIDGKIPKYCVGVKFYFVDEEDLVEFKLRFL